MTREGGMYIVCAALVRQLYHCPHIQISCGRKKRKENPFERTDPNIGSRKGLLDQGHFMLPTRNVNTAARHGQSHVQAPFAIYTVAFIASMRYFFK